MITTIATTTITTLGGLTSADASHAGGKASNCARLKQAGFPVPDGLVILSTATRDDLTALADHPWLDGLPRDTKFAVRSSGIGEDSEGESFAGIHETFLNVQRGDLRDAVDRCRASAHSAQAVEYRRAKKLSADDVQMGVLIQCMVHPVASGVAFTINPVSGANDEVVINASWGLGEALVSGQIDPDEFLVRKTTGELLWSRIGDKGGDDGSPSTSLTPDQLRELTGILKGIERHYGAPQDVEWCHDGESFWIVQSRPVTTSVARTDETEWTRANLAEVLPDLTSPQALAAFEDMLNRGERLYLGTLMAPEAKLGPMVKAFGGRLYFNVSQLRRICAAGRVPAAQMLRSMGHADAIEPADETPRTLPLGEMLAVIPSGIRLMWSHARAASIVREHDALTQADLSRLASLDPERLSDSDVWTVMDDWLHRAPTYMQTVFLLGGVVYHEAPVKKACEKVGFPFEQLVYPQLAAGERSVSAQQAFDLDALVETARREPAVVRYLSFDEPPPIADLRAALRGTTFLAEFERFLEEYGHRGRYESDWALPRYAEDPTPLLRAIHAHLDDASGNRASDETETRRREQAATDAWTAFEQKLSWLQRLTMLPRVRKAVRTIKQYYVWREQVRSDLVKVLAAIRALHLLLADRFVERGWLDDRDDYFLLRLDEIAALVSADRGPETLRIIAANRRAELERYRSMSMPLLMRESDLPRLMRMSGISGRPADEHQLTGHPVSGGCVEAEVVVVRDPADFGRMKRGAILVAPATDPSWTPLFTLASGVIVEVGGVLSHASTIAREYGLPALANVRHATKRLKTGERVRLDANGGVVYRLSGDAD